MKRYEALANEIAGSILSGVLCVGDRLPSVRQTCASRRVSPATVFQAYYRLEARGLVQARERQGYFVTAGACRGVAAPPQAVAPPGESTTVDVSALVTSILTSAGNQAIVPLGSAFPSPLLFPLTALARSMSAELPRLNPWHTTENIVAGHPGLRREIALRYLLLGMQVNPDDIIITNGAMEAINLSLQAVTRPGDTVVVDSPTFYGPLQAIERLGLKAVEVASDARNGIDLVALEQQLLRHRPKACLLMTNCQHPLGVTLTDAKKQALVALLAQHQTVMIEDDVYGELHFGVRRPVPAKAFDENGLVILCGSFSKNLAPGYRIGWVLAGRAAPAIAQLKLSSSLAVSAPPQLALAHYLNKGRYERHLQLLRHVLACNRDLMAEAILRYFPSGTLATYPSGGYFIWLALPGDADALAIHREALAQGVSVAPGPMFSARRAFRNCLRINYGHQWDARVEAALALLGRMAAV